MAIEQQSNKAPVVRDYKTPRMPVTVRHTHRHVVLALIGVSLLGTLIFFVSSNAGASRAKSLDSTSALPDVSLDNRPLDLPLPDQEALPVDDGLTKTAPEWVTETVRPGDSMATIFARAGLSPRQLYEIMSLGGDTQRLKNISPGQQLRFAFLEGDLEQLVYEIDRLQTLTVARKDTGYSAVLDTRNYEIRVNNASGVINNSLFMDAQQAGLTEPTIMALAGIFGWDIDFALDIRGGDQFTLVYEELFLDGEKVRDGNILAAEFVNRDTVFRAVRYTDADGRSDYYTPDGKSMRKAFLRSPVDFTRISSRFGSRFHPVLNSWRAHKGVDYAAPIGTPVKAAGDGKIVHMGPKGGYGKAVIVQHGGTYSTLYGHLYRYQKGLGAGSRVRQGQIIGYVGQSGLATGPHLHYEFRVNGVHRNPLKVPLPDAAPITAEQAPDFSATTRGLLALLDVLTRTQVALGGPQ